MPNQKKNTTIQTGFASFQYELEQLIKTICSHARHTTPAVAAIFPAIIASGLYLTNQENTFDQYCTPIHNGSAYGVNPNLTEPQKEQAYLHFPGACYRGPKGLLTMFFAYHFELCILFSAILLIKHTLQKCPTAKQGENTTETTSEASINIEQSKEAAAEEEEEEEKRGDKELTRPPLNPNTLSQIIKAYPDKIRTALTQTAFASAYNGNKIVTHVARPITLIIVAGMLFYPQEENHAIPFQPTLVTLTQEMFDLITHSITKELTFISFASVLWLKATEAILLLLSSSTKLSGSHLPQFFKWNLWPVLAGDSLLSYLKIFNEWDKSSFSNLTIISLGNFCAGGLVLSALSLVFAGISWCFGATRIAARLKELAQHHFPTLALSRNDALATLVYFPINMTICIVEHFIAYFVGSFPQMAPSVSAYAARFFDRQGILGWHSNPVLRFPISNERFLTTIKEATQKSDAVTLMRYGLWPSCFNKRQKQIIGSHFYSAENNSLSDQLISELPLVKYMVETDQATAESNTDIESQQAAETLKQKLERLLGSQTYHKLTTRMTILTSAYLESKNGAASSDPNAYQAMRPS